MIEHPLVSTLMSMTTPLAQSLGLSIWGIDVAFGGRSVVRIFVEGEGGVSIDKCAELSRLLSLSLDVEDIIPEAYVLEVSSPGLDRIFFSEDQLAAAVGQTVELTLQSPSEAFSGRRKFKGVLTASAVSPENTRLFTLQVDDPSRPGEVEGELTLCFDELKRARQIHVIPEKVLPGKGPGKKKKAATPDCRPDDEDSIENDR